MKGKKVVMVSKYARRIAFVVPLITLCLNQSCVGGSSAPPAQIVPAVTATGTDKTTPTATTTPQPTSPETPNAAEPEQVSVYYVSDNQLYFQQLGEQPQALLVLPDLGPVKDALKVKDDIFVLCERGLQKVSLADRSVDLVDQFTNVTINGRLLTDINQEILFYAIDQKVKRYDLGTRRTSEVFSQSGDLSQPSFFVPLGLSADGTKLYLMPRGQDPEFAGILILTLSNGEVKSFPIGVGTMAAVSPNSRYLAIDSTHFVKLELPLENKLTLFDLASPQTPGQILTLPNSPSHIHGQPVWSSDSQRLYFLLRPGAPYDDPATSHGLWRFEVGTKTFSRIANLDDPWLHFISLSPDGEWALLIPEREFSITLVRFDSGEIETIKTPAGQLPYVVRYQVIPD